MCRIFIITVVLSTSFKYCGYVSQHRKRLKWLLLFCVCRPTIFRKVGIESRLFTMQILTAASLASAPICLVAKRHTLGTTLLLFSTTENDCKNYALLVSYPLFQKIIYNRMSVKWFKYAYGLHMVMFSGKVSTNLPMPFRVTFWH